MRMFNFKRGTQRSQIKLNEFPNDKDDCIGVITAVDPNNGGWGLDSGSLPLGKPSMKGRELAGAVYAEYFTILTNVRIVWAQKDYMAGNYPRLTRADYEGEL